MQICQATEISERQIQQQLTEMQVSFTATPGGDTNNGNQPKLQQKLNVDVAIHSMDLELVQLLANHAINVGKGKFCLHLQNNSKERESSLYGTQ